MRKHQSVFTITVQEGHKLIHLHMDLSFETLPNIAVGLVELISMWSWPH